MNHGFAGGVNVGALVAKGKYLVLLNNDAEPEPQFLGEMVTAMEKSGADAGCGVLLEEGREPANDSLNVLGYNIPRVFGDAPLAFYPSGGAAIIRRDSLSALGTGVFDSTYFIYHEDVSLGFRIRLAGGDVIKIPTARAKHVGSVTTRKLAKADVRYFQMRNRILNRLIYLQAGTKFRLAPLCIAEWLARHAAMFTSPAKMAAVLRVDGFLMSNFSYVAAKRREAGCLRRLRPLAKTSGLPVRDADFLPLLSGRANGRHGSADALALWWMKLMRLPVAELTRKGF
jgi:GT2 family glycosyltransferase